MVKELSDKKKLKYAKEIVLIEYVAIMDYFLNNNPEDAAEFFEKIELNCFMNYYFGTAAKIGAKVMGSISKDSLMKMAIDENFESMAFLMPVSDLNIQFEKNETTIDIPKCNLKKDFNKTAKKCKIKIPTEAFCKLWCTPFFNNSVTPFGFELECQHKDKGCLMTIRSA